jgi:hypothetical protein
MRPVTREEAKFVVTQKGSAETETDNVPYVTTVDSKDPVSSWLVIPAKKPKIDYDEALKAIDVTLTELKPNIPVVATTFITKEQYDTLLSQSIDLNATIEELRTNTITLNSRINELETQTDSEISERLSIQQTNLVLVNQLTSLSDTINGFGEQISSAVQKSIEESILRTSLQAQNEGFKAQIQALISQADSLNAIITGLYAQLGAAQTQKEIENNAESLAQEIQGININNVVVSKFKPGTLKIFTDPNGSMEYDYYGAVNNRNGEFKWAVGGDLTLKNVNLLPAEVTIKLFYPKYKTTSTIEQRFFKFVGQQTFAMGGNQTVKIPTIYTQDGIQDGLIGYRLIVQPKTIDYRYGRIEITIKVETNAPVTKTLNLALGIMHPDTFSKY